MTLEHDAAWWLLGLLVFLVIFIGVMLLRNRAAKTDAIGRSEKDAESPHLNKDLQKDTQKLD